MIAFAFLLFALLIVAWLVAPQSVRKPAAEQAPSGSLQIGDATA